MKSGKYENYTKAQLEEAIKNWEDLVAYCNEALKNKNSMLGTTQQWVINTRMQMRSAAKRTLEDLYEVQKTKELLLL